MDGTTLIIILGIVAVMIILFGVGVVRGMRGGAKNGSRVVPPSVSSNEILIDTGQSTPMPHQQQQQVPTHHTPPVHHMPPPTIHHSPPPPPPPMHH